MTLNSRPLTLLLLVVGCGGQSVRQGSSSVAGSGAGTDSGALPGAIGGTANGTSGSANSTDTGGTINGTGGSASGTDAGGTTSNTGGTTSNTAGTASGNTGGDGCSGPLIEGQPLATLHVPVTFPRAVGQTLSQALPGSFGLCLGAISYRSAMGGSTVDCLFGRYGFSTQPDPESDGVEFTGGNIQLYVNPSTIDGQYDLFASWQSGVSGEVDQLYYATSGNPQIITIFNGIVDYNSTTQGCYQYLLGDVTLTQPVSLVESDGAGEGGAAGASQ